MADRRLSAHFAAALALFAGGCDWVPQRSGPSVVRVKLPPARAAQPGFAFQEGRKPADPSASPSGRSGVE